jgi:hypothetical protein
VTLPVLHMELAQEAARLDRTLVLLGDRLQRVLTAQGLTWDARRALNDRLALVSGQAPPEGEKFALLEMSAGRCRDIVKSLESA